jgi:hypothetical protein
MIGGAVMSFTYVRDARLRDLLEQGRAAREMSAVVRSHSNVLRVESLELRARIDAAVTRSNRILVGQQ